MKAISLWQPWASLIAIKRKLYETRSWPAPASIIGKRIAICSAKTTKGFMYMLADENLLSVVNASTLFMDTMPMGAIVAICKVGSPIRTEVKTAGNLIKVEEWVGDWTTGRWAWPLKDIVQLKNPVPVVGHQGIFNLSAEEEAAVVAQIDKSEGPGNQESLFGEMLT